MAGMLKEINDKIFKNEIANGVVLVDFTAAWCGPCRALAPILLEVAERLAGKAKVAKMDIDENQNTTSAFDVTSVPTLILFKEGKEIKRVVGLKDADTLVNMVSAEL